MFFISNKIVSQVFVFTHLYISIALNYLKHNQNKHTSYDLYFKFHLI